MPTDVEQLRRAIDTVIEAARLGIQAFEQPAERQTARAALDVVIRYRATLAPPNGTPDAARG